MSRLGKKPIPVPSGVKVQIDGCMCKVEGPKGKLAWEFQPTLKVQMDNGQVVVQRSSDSKTQKALHGLTRAMLNNMVTGVTQGFERVLEINGVGYRANVEGKKLSLQLGYSHPIHFEIPTGIEISVERQTRVSVKGIDKHLVGQVAANIRRMRVPDPYKVKGIKFVDEVVRRKAGKAGA